MLFKVSNTMDKSEAQHVKIKPKPVYPIQAIIVRAKGQRISLQYKKKDQMLKAAVIHILLLLNTNTLNKQVSSFSQHPFSTET